MRMCAALVLLVAASAVRADGDSPAWESNLGIALARATREGKSVLLRQVVCACRERTCSLSELATRPWYLKKGEAHDFAAERFVWAAVHVAPEKAGEDLRDPGFPAVTSPLRTLFVTSHGAIVHRLDLCPQSGDVLAEMKFAARVAEACQEEDGALKHDWAKALVVMHRAHEAVPMTVHASAEGVRAPECGCAPPAGHNKASRLAWSGYQTGVFWHSDLAEAKEIAARSEKLVLFFQIAGDMNKEGC